MDLTKSQTRLSFILPKTRVGRIQISQSMQATEMSRLDYSTITKTQLSRRQLSSQNLTTRLRSSSQISNSKKCPDLSSQNQLQTSKHLRDSQTLTPWERHYEKTHLQTRQTSQKVN